VSTTIETAQRATTNDVGFLLAKASTRWNERLAAAFAERGYPDVRAAYGSVLLPLFERDGLRMGELTAAARQPKQTTTTLVRQLERDGLVLRLHDEHDGRSWRVWLTERAKAFRPVAEEVLANLDAQLSEHLSRTSYEALRRGLQGVMEL
jgi:DNA-binding MarR family transcriptional regulator